MTIAALLLAQAVPMHADGQVCPATPAPAPAGWAAMTPVVAGASSATAAAPPLGRGAWATLRPAEMVKLAVAMRKPAAPGSSSGLFAFDAPAAGRYRVALGADVWIDVVATGVAPPAAAHGHGPACSPVKKMVEFDLMPGRYLLQVVGGAAPTLTVMGMGMVSRA